MRIAYFVILSMRKNMDFITTLSNIEGICRSCYTLCCFTVPTIYLPIIAVLLVTYDELLRLILRLYFPLQRYCGEGMPGTAMQVCSLMAWWT